MTDTTKQTVQSWCADRINGDGVLAVGGGFPDGAVFTGLIAPEFVLAHNEDVWRSIGLALKRTRESGAPCDELLWSFEGASLLTAIRADGCWLGVFLTPESVERTADPVRALLREFQSLTLAN